ncbi:MAG TPA: helix-turn-helix domain-containing protein [Thermoanaerobaculia bacterium]|nr:helix-turn-helix domain-containing protein [Thermoanaerobaculia bacterium]
MRVHSEEKTTLSRRYDPEVTRIMVALLRMLRDWSRDDLADALGAARNTIWRYEAKGPPDPVQALEEIASAVGLPPRLLDRLLSAVAASRAAVESAADPGNPVKRIEAFASEIAVELSDIAHAATALLLGGDPEPPAPPPRPEDREEARELWEALSRHDPSMRRILVEESARFRKWALCERLCAESRQAASPEEAQELADLALRIAELAPGEESWRLRLQGYAWAHVASASRARGETAEAGDAWETARLLWEAGAPGDPGLLEEGWGLGLERVS